MPGTATSLHRLHKVTAVAASEEADGKAEAVGAAGIRADGTVEALVDSPGKAVDSNSSRDGDNRGANGLVEMVARHKVRKTRI